jgi:hypothetical protein
MRDWDQLAFDLDAVIESPVTVSSRGKPKLVPLCGPCLAESVRWLDTSPATLLPRLGIAYGSGADYDVSETGMRERRSARHAEWLATVRFQRRLVAEGCRAGRHAGRGDG